MPERRPNVLVVFTDQQRFDTIGALGNGVIRTPNLDRLAREGIAFRSAYSPSPVCVPARCSFLYGQYPFRTDCYDNDDPMPDDGRRSFFGALADEGYRTHGVGKCHFTPDPAALRGFQSRETQEEIVRSPADDDYLTHLQASGFDHVADPHGVRGELYYVPQIAQMPPALHPTRWVGDRSVAFVEGAAWGDQPWCLYASFIHPHPPFAPPSPWHKLYRAPLMPLPKVPADAEALHAYVNRHQNRYKFRDQGIDQNLLRTQKAHYYACVSFIDFQVGRLLASLEATNQLENTLIVFTSDHGEHLGDYNCFGKRSFHDSCARVPLLMRLPGRFAGGQTCDAPASLVDVAPTVLAACGVETDASEHDGLDLAGVVTSAAGSETRRDAVFSQYQREGLAIYTAVTPRWKYAYSAPDGREFLFDRVADPSETRSQAGLTFRRGELAGMRDLTISRLQSADALAGLDGDRWREFPRRDVDDDPDAGLLIQDHPWAEIQIPGYSD